MLSAVAFPLFRLLLVYISGVLIAICCPIEPFHAVMLLIALKMLYLVTWIGFKAARLLSKWPHIIGLLVIFLVGYSNLVLQIAPYQKLLTWTNQPIEGYTASIQKVYHSLSCKALITHIKANSGWHKHPASIQLFFSKKSGYKPQKGDALLISGTPTRIAPSKNRELPPPYASFYHPSMHRHVLKQIDRDFIYLQPVCKNRQWVRVIREWCSQIFEKQLQDTTARGVVAALLWGEKDGLNPDLQKAYAQTGTIHVLAISGLHVTMLYLLMKTIFRFVFSRIGYWILPELLSLLFIWLYAGLCDFTPPIVRATIMITMARLGLLMGRGSNSYNGLIVSAFGLLLWNPLLLFNCGFQLSYSATLGILYLQPFIHRLTTLKNYWLQKIWTATTLSIAAQLSTLPLILFYFKQFPLYFIIANWLVIPAIFAILMLSLALLVGSHLPIVGTLLGFILNKLIVATNGWVCWVAKWPMSTLSCCAVNGRSACLLYVVLLATSLFLQYKQLIYPVTISICTLFYSIDQLQLILSKQKQCKMICCNHHQLSFTLKDGIETLGCNRPLSKSSPLRHYAGGTIASWYKKMILTIDKIPIDWHRWHGAKLDIDYLLIDEKLLSDMDIILKVCNIKTLVIYTKEVRPFYYHPAIKTLSLAVIWLQPGAKKVFSWPKNL